jgi:glycosyltransferase involved in cell wall biosynthesis
MRILIITAYYREEARSIPTSYKLARLFAEHGNHVAVLTSKAISRRTDERHRNIRVYETKDIFIKDPLNINVMPYLFSALSDVLKKEKPDVCIISKYIFFPIVALPYLKMKGQKVVVVTDTYPGVVWFARSRIVNFFAKLHYHVVGRLLLRRSDLLVLTHEGLVEATRNLGIRNYRVIHNGIDLAKTDSARPAGDIKKKPGDIIIAFVGRLASIKGLDTLLEASKGVLKRHTNVRLLLVGDGDSSSLPRHARITYAGYRKDVINVLKKCDIFVMPSISEGLPSAVIEAMACGIPVIGSDIPGGMKVLVRDKVTGLSFRKGDSRDLERKIELLVKDAKLRQKLGKNARLHVEKSFNDETAYKQWISALSELKESGK